VAHAACRSGFGFGRPQLVRRASQSVAGDRTLFRSLEQVGGAFGRGVAGNSQSSDLLQQALPVALDSVETFDRRMRPEPAVHDLAEGGSHVAPSRARLHEQVLDSRDKGAQIRLGGAVLRPAATTGKRERDGGAYEHCDRGGGHERPSPSPGRCGCFRGGVRSPSTDLERGIVAQDRALELLQRFAWFDAELAHKGLAGTSVLLERICLAAGAIEREHQLLAQALPERVLCDERFQLGD
jgi:hypothetical protein